ncbi:MAG: hypothetical protein RLZZ450_6670 [Pseudomonadota bacterium]|jgi:hypothetical protein
MKIVGWGSLLALGLGLSGCPAEPAGRGDASLDGSIFDATSLVDGGPRGPSNPGDSATPSPDAQRPSDAGPSPIGDAARDAAEHPSTDAALAPDATLLTDAAVEPADAASEPPDAGPAPVDATIEEPFDAGPQPVDAGPPPEDTAVVVPVDAGPPVPTFTDVYAIITAKCAFCHSSGNIGITIGRLDLSTGPHAYNNMVGQLSTGNDCSPKGGTRVIPGDAANSLLLHKLEGTPECGVRMPDTFPALDPAEVDVFRGWVAAGALPDATSNGVVDYPALLSGTGLFANVASGTLAAGVRAYEPLYKLWSDGADKRRWLLLPAGSTIDTSDMDFWVYPVGTKAFKEFSIGGTRVETRMLHKVANNHWAFVSYKWRADLSDADAVPEGEANALGTTHDIPDQGTCFACHANMVDRLLGVSALQLNNPASPLTLLELQNSGRLSAPAAALPVLPGDGVAQAALGYLHANCGTCHNQRSLVYQQLLNRNPNTGGPVLWQRTNQLASVETTLGYTTTVGRPNGVLPNLRIIQPGQPEQSELYVRMSQRGPGSLQMPPTGTEVVDSAGGLSAVGAFIQGLP